MRSIKILLVLLLVVIVLGTYWPSRNFPFQFDDALFLRDDNVKLGRWEAFVWPPQPRLLPWLSFLIQYQIHGHDPGPYHAVNVLLHALNALLVFLLLIEILRPTDGLNNRPSLVTLGFGTLVFALHPAQTESVLYVYQRSTLLAALFAFLTMLAYLKSRFLAATFFLVLALLSKEFTVLLPLLLWAVKGLLGKNWRLDRWLALYLCIGLFAGISYLLAVLFSASGTLGGNVTESAVYAVTQVRMIWSYVALTLFPISLNIDHDVLPQETLLDLSWWAMLLSLICVLAVFFLARTRFPRVTFLALVFFAFLVPTSSLVPSQDYFFEHRLYASLFGFVGLMALLAHYGGRFLIGCKTGPPSERSLQWLIAVLAMGVLPAYAFIDVDRMRDWSSEVGLWRDAVEKSPNKYRPNYNLGVVLIGEAPEEAVFFLSRAISIDPHLPLAYRSLGEVCSRLGNRQSAERLWKTALQLDPEHAATHLALGRLYAEKSDFFNAHHHLARAQELDPRDWRSYLYLARLDFQFGFFEQANLQSEMGLNRAPDHVGLKTLLADSMAETRNWKRAIRLYREVLQRDAANALVYYKLARIYWISGEQDRAVEAAREGMVISKSAEELELGQSLVSGILSEAPEKQ